MRSPAYPLSLASLPLLLSLALPLSGCHAAANPASTAAAAADQRAQTETDREQMQQIPPPTKSKFISVHSFDSWMNPYLTVQAGMIGLHVTRGDSNTTPIGAGGMLRPIGARQVELNIANDRLGEAMTAIPPDAWPYGRVVAIEEAHKTPASAEPAVRRNMERVIRQLNDLGIVVYDLADGSVR